MNPTSLRRVAFAISTTLIQSASASAQAVSGKNHIFTSVHAVLALRLVLTALTILAATVLLRSLAPLTRWAKEKLVTRSVTHLRSSQRQGLSLIDTEQLTEVINLILTALRLLISALILYLAFHFLLSIFPQTHGFADRMFAAVLDPIKELGGNAWKSAPSLIFICIIAVFCRYLLRFVAFAFDKIKQGHVTISGFRPIWVPTTQRLVSIFIVLLAALVAYPYIPGSQSQAFKGFSLFLGVLVSLGSTGLVSNMFNGIMLTYVDSFQPGDYIQIGETQGYVQATSLFVTRLKTPHGRIITIPNSTVLSSQITNYSSADDNSTSLSVTAGVGYDVPWRQAEAMLLNAARKTAGVREVPASFVLEISLNSVDVAYELTVFLSPERPVSAVRADLHRNLLDEFSLYGIQLMTPMYMSDLPKPVAQNDWYAPPAKKPEDITHSNNTDSTHV